MKIYVVIAQPSPEFVELVHAFYDRKIAHQYAETATKNSCKLYHYVEEVTLS